MGPTIAPENTTFVPLSFEGPGCYSSAGGLGVRITNLSQALADQGFATHLFFIGDSVRRGDEAFNGGQLSLHPWCQWISQYYPKGVYEGENQKLYDFNESIPGFVIEHIVKPALGQNKLVVIMGEEWHTAEAMCRISDRLHSQGLRDRVVMFWNANNTFGFDRIDWKRLAYTTTITTVSRYMKHFMWKLGVNPLVIPNGIPESSLDEVDTNASIRLSRSLDADLILAKIARWDPDKRWNAAFEAAARLKARGLRTVLLARGGIEHHGEEVLRNARSLGLRVKDIGSSTGSLKDQLDAIGDRDGADVLNIRFHCSPELLRIIYHASDAVLANSGHEPFGLVGLETMAAGGIAFTGGTGEDYAVHLHNSIVLDTADPKEIEAYVVYLEEHPEEKHRIRQSARRTARRFTWEEVTKDLIQKLTFQASAQGLLKTLEKAAASSSGPSEYSDADPTSEAVAVPST
jgi:glycosyltransferase involved in cell wall biosynthesis